MYLKTLNSLEEPRRRIPDPQRAEVAGNMVGYPSVQGSKHRVDSFLVNQLQDIFMEVVGIFGDFFPVRYVENSRIILGQGEAA